MSGISSGATSMSEMIPLLRLLQQPGDLAPSFTVDDASRIAAALMDGGVDDFEVGALLASLVPHIAAPAVVLGFKEAAASRMVPLGLPAPGSPVRPVVLPNFGCSKGGLVNATFLPVVALLLQRLGVPVVVHGVFESSGGMAVANVFRELGVLPCATRAQAENQLAAGRIVLLPLTLVSPGLAALMALKARLGAETPVHVLAPLLCPLPEGAAQAVAGSEEERERIDMVAIEARALLLAQGAGEFGTPGFQLFWRDHEAQHWSPLFAAENLGDARPASPRAVADWTRAIVQGQQTVPVALSHLLAGLLLVSGYAHDVHEAKAIAAVEMSALAAA
jgi:anthranilate phosphoribosyltransferase